MPDLPIDCLFDPIFTCYSVTTAALLVGVHSFIALCHGCVFTVTLSTERHAMLHRVRIAFVAFVDVGIAFLPHVSLLHLPDGATVKASLTKELVPAVCRHRPR